MHGASQHSQVLSKPASTQDDVQERWKLALEAMQSFPAIGERRRPKEDFVESQNSPFIVEELLTLRAGNWPSSGLLSDFRGLIMGMTL